MSGRGLARVHAYSNRGGCYCFIQHVQHVAASTPGVGDMMVIGCMLTGLTYWFSYYCRDISFFRGVDRLWYFDPLGNASIFDTSYYITVAHCNTESAISAFMLLIGVALGFIEIVIPVINYGFLLSEDATAYIVSLLRWFPSQCVAVLSVIVDGHLRHFCVSWFHNNRPARVYDKETRGLPNDYSTVRDS